jgi:hypothetical protein
MAGFGNRIRSISFTVKTIGGNGGGDPAAAARLSTFQVLPNGNPQFTITGTADRVYRVQRAGQVTGVAWQDIGTVTIPGGGSSGFEDTEAGKTLPLFYRVVAD